MPYSPRPENGQIVGDCEVTHRVLLGEGTQVINSRIRGPVIIGDNVTIRNSYIGPYTSIGDNVVVENSEIEASIIMQDCQIGNLMKQGAI